MKFMTRRECLAGLSLTAAAALTARVGAASAKPMRGAFMILNTPFTAAGDVDWDDLAREALFVDRAGCQGIVWPQGSSSVATLTLDERLRGMELLAKTVAGKRVALVLGVQGKDTAEMLDYVRRADALGTDAMIAMPPTTGTSLDDYLAYFRALGKATSRPVIIQTSGGARNLVPSTDLIIQLAREFPHLGHVKEESDPVLERMLAEIKARPPMTSVFGASFADGWLYEMRLGLDGVITGEGMYADVMAALWEMHEKKRADELRSAFAAFLLMRNLEAQVPGTSLYIMKKRGIFKTTVRRASAPTATAPAKLTEFTPNPAQLAEIEYRFEALRPYLKF